MIAVRIAQASVLALTLLVAGCALGRQTSGGEAGEGTVGDSLAAEEGGGVSSERGATILTGEALQDGPGSLLGAMLGKVPGLRVKQTPGHCPEITLRSHVSFRSVTNPHVYVDGTRATDTCILESLRRLDVERVEVYPLGFTHRPGYGTHGPGLILVFMRS